MAEHPTHRFLTGLSDRDPDQERCSACLSGRPTFIPGPGGNRFLLPNSAPTFSRSALGTRPDRLKNSAGPSTDSANMDAEWATDNPSAMTGTRAPNGTSGAGTTTLTVRPNEAVSSERVKER